MNQQEQTRIQVLTSVLEYHTPIAQAAESMAVSERHTKRLLAAYRKDGAVALAHGNRGGRDERQLGGVLKVAVTAVDLTESRPRSLACLYGPGNPVVVWKYPQSDGPEWFVCPSR